MASIAEVTSGRKPGPVAGLESQDGWMEQSEQRRLQGMLSASHSHARDCVRVSRLESRHHSLLSLTHRDLLLWLVSHERSIY